MSSEIFQAVLCVCASGLAQGQGTGLPGGLPGWTISAELIVECTVQPQGLNCSLPFLFLPVVLAHC